MHAEFTQNYIFASTNLMEMLVTILIALLIVAISLVFLGIRMLLVKGGKFPNTHISGSKAMRDRGIGCAQSQDREARKKSFRDMENALNDHLN